MRGSLSISFPVDIKNKSVSKGAFTFQGDDDDDVQALDLPENVTQLAEVTWPVRSEWAMGQWVCVDFDGFLLFICLCVSLFSLLCVDFAGFRN